MGKAPWRRALIAPEEGILEQDAHLRVYLWTPTKYPHPPAGFWGKPTLQEHLLWQPAPNTAPLFDQWSLGDREWMELQDRLRGCAQLFYTHVGEEQAVWNHLGAWRSLICTGEQPCL